MCCSRSSVLACPRNCDSEYEDVTSSSSTHEPSLWRCLEKLPIPSLDEYDLLSPTCVTERSAACLLQPLQCCHAGFKLRWSNRNSWGHSRATSRRKQLEARRSVLTPHMRTIDRRSGTNRVQAVQGSKCCQDHWLAVDANWGPAVLLTHFSIFFIFY